MLKIQFTTTQFHDGSTEIIARYRNPPISIHGYFHPGRQALETWVDTGDGWVPETESCADLQQAIASMTESIRVGIALVEIGFQ
jgi:hypothetical protein